MNNMITEWGANCITEFRKHKEQDESTKQQKYIGITEKVKKVQKLQQTVRIVIHEKLDVDKLQLNKMFSSFNKLSFDEEVHCFIRQPANPNANEWYFSYASSVLPVYAGDQNSVNSIELYTRSKGVSQDQMTDRLAYTTNVFNLLSVYYENNEIINNIMLKNMLLQVNHEKANDPSYSQGRKILPPP